VDGTQNPGPGGRRGLKAAARTFAAGAGCGFVAGAFVVAAIVWQFGNVIGSRADSVRTPAQPPAAVARWEDGLHDDVGGIIEPADVPAGTSGTAAVDEGHAAVAPPRPESTVDAPVIGPATESPKELEARDLEIPVEGIKPEQLTRQFSDRRGGSRMHEAIDILAPRNTPVKAVEDGRIARLFFSKAGGITIYQFDPSEQYCYYYAHLERYADGLREGDPVRKGQVIGYVGTSGNAPKNTPHLHFAVFRLTGLQRWWEGTPIDPYDILR
jgi:murein DD-endopeptidase MepM/ murein hydrolase activator NlpD